MSGGRPSGRDAAHIRDDRDGARTDRRPRRPGDVIAFLALFGASLVVTAAANHGAGRVLIAIAPQADWIATAAIPSCLAIGGLYVLYGDRRALRWPRLDRPAAWWVLRLSMAWWVPWIAGCVLVAASTGRWITYAHGLPAVTAFLVFGPIGEELLFRGLIFERARRLWPTTPRHAIYLSTVAFSLHHIALGAAPATLAAAQFAFTLPMGFVFAMLRERTGSLWPALLLHVVTNLPAAV